MAQPQPLYSRSDDIGQETVKSTPPDDSMPPLRLLARLPEVAVPANKSKFALRLAWLQRLDWQQVRRIKLDPNWVAGGVLSLVLVLLLTITFNRSSRQSADPTPADEAPTWSTAGKSPQSSRSPVPEDGAPLSASAAASPGNTTLPVDNVAPPTSESEVRRLAAETSGPATDSLEGIYYPNTGYGEITIHPAISNQIADQPRYGGELRTAHRDAIQPYQAPQPTAPPPSGQARFDGDIITQPQH
jgi:hypothetical protein